MARGDGRIYLRGSVYWACYYLRGVQYRESTKETDQKKAEKFLQDRRDERGADKIGTKPFVTPKAKRITVAQLCQSLRAKYELHDKASKQNLVTWRGPKKISATSALWNSTPITLMNILKSASKTGTPKRRSTEQPACCCKRMNSQSKTRSYRSARASRIFLKRATREKASSSLNNLKNCAGLSPLT